MNNYLIRQIKTDEYETVRQLDSDAFRYNERGSDGEFHRIFADNIRRSPYFIPELDLVAVTNQGFILGHGIFSALPMGDAANHVVWLNSLAVRHGEKDNHAEKKYEYQRKGIGTAIVKHGLEVAKSLGFTACMTCGHPAVYQKKMGFKNYRELGIKKDDSVEDPDECIFAVELAPAGFDCTNRLLSYLYYDFFKSGK
jgi:predicted N-acetyltransferase YhbS